MKTCYFLFLFFKKKNSFLVIKHVFQYFLFFEKYKTIFENSCQTSPCCFQNSFKKSKNYSLNIENKIPNGTNDIKGLQIWKKYSYE